MSQTAVILSQDEIAQLPQAKRPLNFRISSRIYHAVWEHIGAASLHPSPEHIEKEAIDLCFKIAEELERLNIDPRRINENAPPLPNIP